MARSLDPVGNPCTVACRRLNTGCTQLDEGHKLSVQCIWDVLSGEGLPVWVCGSMNVRHDVPLNGYVLPDPWAVSVGRAAQGQNDVRYVL